MALYFTDEELKKSLTKNIFLEIFNDGEGEADLDAVELIRFRASTLVDSHLAKAFKGPFPMPDPVPPLVKSAALFFGIWLSWRQAPEVARRYGREGSFSEYKEGKALCVEVATNETRLVNTPAAPEPANVGVKVGFGSRCARDGVGGGFWKKGFGGF